MPKGTKTDPLFVKNSVESEGWKLHDVYKNNATKMHATCPNGHDVFVVWGNWRKGVRCKKCINYGLRNSTGRRSLDPLFVKESIESENYILHGAYKNAMTKMAITCPNGHDSFMNWHHWKRGTRCRTCFYENLAKVLTLDHSFVKKSIESEGWVLHEPYTSAKKAMAATCNNGHNTSVKWYHWNSGLRCKQCALDNQRLKHSFVESAFTEIGYTLISEYKGNQEKIDFICDNGHTHSTTWNQFSRGVRCASCASHGFNPDKSASIYYLRFDINTTPYYKIGITNRTIEERFSQEPIPYTILYEHRYLIGILAKQDESDILKKHKRYLYKGPPILKSGNTELFTKDVLKLDKCQTKTLSLSI